MIYRKDTCSLETRYYLTQRFAGINVGESFVVNHHYGSLVRDPRQRLADRLLRARHCIRSTVKRLQREASLHGCSYGGCGVCTSCADLTMAKIRATGKNI